MENDNKKSNFILDHLKIIVGALIGVIMVIVCGLVMLNSYNQFKKDDQAYNDNDLLVRSGVEAAPKKIAINDQFASYKDDGSIKSTKSNLKNKMSAFADELVTDVDVDLEGSGKLGTYIPNTVGSVSLNLTVDKTTFVDIDFVISSGYAGATTFDTEDILGQVNFKVNNNTIEGNNIVLKNDSEGEVEFHHLVMTGFAIPEGDLKISVNAISGKTAYMPNIRNISVFADATIAQAE